MKRDIHLPIEIHFEDISSNHTSYYENPEQAEKPSVTPRKPKHERSPELPDYLIACINSYFIARCIIYVSFLSAYFRRLSFLDALVHIVSAFKTQLQILHKHNNHRLYSLISILNAYLFIAVKLGISSLSVHVISIKKISLIYLLI